MHGLGGAGGALQGGSVEDVADFADAVGGLDAHERKETGGFGGGVRDDGEVRGVGRGGEGDDVVLEGGEGGEWAGEHVRPEGVVGRAARGSEEVGCVFGAHGDEGDEASGKGYFLGTGSRSGVDKRAQRTVYGQIN